MEKLIKKTYVAKEKDVKRNWYLIDAEDKILGRLAAKIAVILRGKHKSIYTPHVDTGDGIIVINASKIKVTGKKLKEKLYRFHSGYPGGLKEIPLEKLLNKNPTKVLRLAVKRMIPNNPLGRRMLKKLKIYSEQIHPHQGLKPEKLEV